MRAAINVLLLIVLIALLAFNWLASNDVEKRNFEFLPNMVSSVPYDAYARNPNFADGKTPQ